MLNPQEENVAFTNLENKPNYEWTLTQNEDTINEQQVLASLEDQVKTTYTMYAVTLDGEEKTYVKNETEAQQVVQQIKEEQQVNDEKLGIRQVYTEENKEVESVEVAVQAIEENEEIQSKQEEEVIPQTSIAVVNGIAIANKPITGTITSRYGVSSRIRSSNHTGLDISAKSGTPIKACSSGTVVFAGNKGSYGKLVRISHGNGVETWYAHCSKLYVSKGQEIEAGETVAAVGSTGNSTGPHLHLEIRINDNPINPQKYLYQ